MGEPGAQPNNDRQLRIHPFRPARPKLVLQSPIPAPSPIISDARDPSKVPPDCQTKRAFGESVGRLPTPPGEPSSAAPGCTTGATWRTSLCTRNPLFLFESIHGGGSREFEKKFTILMDTRSIAKYTMGN